MFKTIIKQIIIFGIAALAVIFAFNAFAQESAQSARGGQGGQTKSVPIVAFHQTGCPHCADQQKFFKDNLKNNYKVDIKIYDILDNSANIQLFQAMAGAYGKTIDGVPTVFIGEQVFSGHDANVELGIIAEVKRCLAEGCQSPLEKLKDFKPDSQPITIDAKYKNIGYVVLGAVGVLIIVIIAFTVKPKKKE